MKDIRRLKLKWKKNVFCSVIDSFFIVSTWKDPDVLSADAFSIGNTFHLSNRNIKFIYRENGIELIEIRKLKNSMLRRLNFNWKKLFKHNLLNEGKHIQYKWIFRQHNSNFILRYLFNANFIFHSYSQCNFIQCATCSYRGDFVPDKIQ